MALFNRAGNILGQTNEISVAMRRCMYHWKVFVGGLGRATNETNLREAFSIYGEIAEVKLLKDRKTGKSRGYGFVTFKEYEPAFYSVVDMDQWELHGRTVTVRWANDVDSKLPLEFDTVVSDSDDSDHSNDSNPCT